MPWYSSMRANSGKFGTFQSKLDKNNTPPTSPTRSKSIFFLCYNQGLDHTREYNLYELLKVRCWWTTMRANVKEVLQLCEIYKKFASAPEPPNLVIPVNVKVPFSTWAIAVVGTMLPPAQTPQKEVVITAAEYVKQ